MPGLLADFGDIIPFAAPAVFFVIWIIGQVIKAATGNVLRPGWKGLAREAQAGNQENPELEWNLRPAAQRRERGQSGEVEIISAELADDPIDAEIVDQGVSGHVEHYMDSHEFQDRTARLGHGVDQADEALETRLHDTFDDQLDTLQRELDPTEQTNAYDVAESSGTASGNRDSLAASVALGEIGGILHDPKNLRQAIIMSEILRRPDHRR